MFEVQNGSKTFAYACSQNFTPLLYCSPVFLLVFESQKVALAEVMVVYVHTVSSEVLLRAS